MKSTRTSVILLVFILLVMSPVTASAAYDMFLQIRGIPGDSTDGNHQDWIEVLAYKHDIEQKGGSLGVEGNLEAGRVDHGEFTIRKRFDSASPLAEHLQTGKSIPTITLELCRPEGEKTVYMKYILKNAKVVRVKPANLDESTPTEEVSFRYGEIHWEYTPTVSNNTGGILLKRLYNGEGILEVNSEGVIKGNPKFLSFD